MGQVEVMAYAARVRALLARPETGGDGPLIAAQVDDILTDGCALALALEAQCSRLEHMIADLAPRADDPDVARLLRTLPPGLRGAEGRLETVRSAVNAVRSRAGGRLDVIRASRGPRTPRPGCGSPHPA